MLDRDALRASWTRHGATQHDAAVLLNISDRTMSQRMKDGIFGSDEIEKLIMAYHISDPMSVFFAPKVT